jgi:hypothetical protein
VRDVCTDAADRVPPPPFGGAAAREHDDDGAAARDAPPAPARLFGVCAPLRQHSFIIKSSACAAASAAVHAGVGDLARVLEAADARLAAVQAGRLALLRRPMCGGI